MKKCLLVFALLIAARAEASRYCYTSKQYPWGDVFYDITLSEQLGAKGKLVTFTRLSDYPSEAAAMDAAVSVAEQLEKKGECTYIRGWVDF